MDGSEKKTNLHLFDTKYLKDKLTTGGRRKKKLFKYYDKIGKQNERG